MSDAYNKAAKYVQKRNKLLIGLNLLAQLLKEIAAVKMPSLMKCKIHTDATTLSN